MTKSLHRFFIVALLVLPGAASAVVHDGEVGGVRYRVMAPERIPRGEVVSVLIVVTSAAGHRTIEASLVPPSGGFRSIDESSPLKSSMRVDVQSGESSRFAFTGWKALAHAETGEFVFRLTLTAGGSTDAVGGTQELAIPVKTVPGAVVRKGVWSIVVPAAISLLALPLFVLFLRRYARPRAWRDAVDAQLPHDEEAWWADPT